jgi:hypothetical protein
MKRREIKFVAGALQLAPDRIEAFPTLRKAAAAKRPRLTRAPAQKPVTSKAGGKSR